MLARLGPPVGTGGPFFCRCLPPRSDSKLPHKPALPLEASNGEVGAASADADGWVDPEVAPNSGRSRTAKEPRGSTLKRPPRPRRWMVEVLRLKTSSNPIDGSNATHANGGTIGFHMKDAAQAEAWHKAGAANGGTSIEDPPSVRANGAYLAYLRDPDGNKLVGVARPAT